jgi:hypothetical protein
MTVPGEISMAFDNERIRLIAEKDEQPEAQTIRELLETGLRARRQGGQATIGSALRELAEIGKQVGATGPTDLSRNIDKYLYDKQ